MSAKGKKTSPSKSVLSEQASTSSGQPASGYIDDYSQLRLSYYQHRDAFSDISCETFEDISTDESCDTMETNFGETLTVDVKEDERQKLRDYYISQIPDLPHPSYVVASIISSASSKMGPIHFKYNDRIEQGSKVPDSRNDLEFDPQRRSTMKPNQFSNN